MKIKAVILAAGFGSRMGVLTKNTPKPMLKVGGKPILYYTVSQLVKYGVTDICMNLHYHHEQITDYFGDGEKFGASISYVYEKFPSGTAGGVRVLENCLGEYDKLFVIYGDILTDIDFGKLLESHDSGALIVLHKRKKSNSIVEVDLANNEITKFLERPPEAEFEGRDKFWVNSAIYLMDRGVVERIPGEGDCDFPKDIFPSLVEEKKLKAYFLDSNRIAIDDADRLKKANEEINNFLFE